jgi:hypothetical protein
VRQYVYVSASALARVRLHSRATGDYGPAPGLHRTSGSLPVRLTPIPACFLRVSGWFRGGPAPVSGCSSGRGPGGETRDWPFNQRGPRIPRTKHSGRLSRGMMAFLHKTGICWKTQDVPLPLGVLLFQSE